MTKADSSAYTMYVRVFIGLWGQERAVNLQMVPFEGRISVLEKIAQYSCSPHV